MTAWLVTGGAGFIGSHLVERLIGAGDRVIVLDDLSAGQRDNLAAVASSPRLEIVIGSVTDEALLAGLVGRVDVCVHLAAAVGVRRVVNDAVATLRANVRGAECVLTACAAHGVRAFVASSSEVYGSGVRCPFREADDLRLKPSDRVRTGYAAGKLFGEHLALALHRETGLPVTVGRLFNAVGPRQTGRYGMVVPRFVAQALAGGPITVHGDGSQTRSFAHVAGTVRAIEALSRVPTAIGRIVNVGGDEEISIGALAERVRDLVDPRVAIEHVPYADVFGPGFDDPPRRVPDTARLRRLVGFVPHARLDDVLRETLASFSGGVPAGLTTGSSGTGSDRP